MDPLLHTVSFQLASEAKLDVIKQEIADLDAVICDIRCGVSVKLGFQTEDEARAAACVAAKYAKNGALVTPASEER